jgi:signal transduction histidine kinase
MVLNVTLMVCWIVLFVGRETPGALTMGVIAFALILVGLSFWLVLTIKEIRLNHRQANFVDSVTHELKSPIAALQLYLQTLQMRSLDDAKRAEFHTVMEQELHRLDRLISQLLEVGRLDAIGQQDEPESVALAPLIRHYVHKACVHYRCDEAATLSLDLAPVAVHGRRIVLEMIFSNLVDNAVKYAGSPPQVSIRMMEYGASRVRVLIANNGLGVRPEDRKKVFQIFYRGGSELHRRRMGTGLGLYIVHTLVKKLKGRISVRDHANGDAGCVFVLDLPGELIDAPAEAPPSTERTESTALTAPGTPEEHVQAR